MKKIIYIIVFILYVIVIYKVIDIRYLNNKYYLDLYLLKSNNIVYGSTPKRGRILDRNNVVLVDNKSIYNINYRIIKNTKTSDMINYATIISNILSLNEEASTLELKEFYLLTNNTSYLLTLEEKENYTYRKISDEEIHDIKLNRIDNEIKEYSNEDKIMIHTFYLMNKGYLTDNKLIKSDVSYDLCVKITEENIKGLSCDITWQRVINYPIIETILGSVGNIPYEKKDYYLDLGYNSDDYVGISGLEEYYDEYLKGEKSLYEVKSDNSLHLLSDEKPGQDLILALDIKLTEKSYEILKENFETAEKLNNTKYFKEAYIIISNPNTGEILSLVGLQRDKIKNEISYKDISSKAMISSYTVGSIVKGASHTVGYLNNLIDIGKKIQDSCVKIYKVPLKCSFKRLGYIDDISALKMSSNYYQFITAIKSTGNNYTYNMKLDVSEDNFNLYRDVFKHYGLGTSSNIDFPKESLGLKGNIVSSDLLLNLAIGQYDTYTPISLTSYINTIATKGKRYQLSFKKQDRQLIDSVLLEEKYMNRIHQGFYDVVNSGTGLGYTDKKYNAAGKTGTAQNYYDKNIMTINSSYIMFAPYDNPKYSVVVVTPNISYYDGKNDYIAPTNRLISKSITNYLFENY
ncbi:MAG: hypothetical protein IJ572_05740 [Bacilli bacterium]|nr:hypothetical protein [Bacilli bacterium]